MTKIPYSGIAVMSFHVFSENLSKKKSYFFSIFQKFHFECSIKIMHFFLLFLLYIITLFAKNAQNFSFFL